MTEIRFYHLMRGTPSEALARLLLKALSRGRRVVVRVPDETALAAFDRDLWLYPVDQFIPHGTVADGDPALQPVWITCQNENPNRADTLILCSGVQSGDEIKDFDLVCTLFDGHSEEELATARASWKTYKQTYEQTPEILTYWQQTPAGEWEKKA